MSERTYRLNPPDRTGFLLGLSLAQVVLGGLGAMLAASVFSRGHSLAATAIAVGVTATLLGRRKGEALIEVAPVALQWGWRIARRRRRWFAPLPLLVDGSARPIPLPPALQGQRLIAIDGPTSGFASQAKIAVVHDELFGLVSLTLRAGGRRFGLIDADERCEALDAWGELLDGWARERTPVEAIRWTEWAAPAGLELHRVWLDEHQATSPLDEATSTYDQLLIDAGPMVTPHEVLITLVVNGSKVNVVRSRRHERLRVAVDALLAETRSLVSRLDAAGLAAGDPLSPGELGEAIRSRFDPWGLPARHKRARSLGETFGVSPIEHSGPLSCESTWGTWRTDDVVHRTYAVVEWPRRQLRADWLGSVLLQGRGVVRAVTMIYEPIAPSRSRRAITFTDTKLESDEHQRRSRGFRVPAALVRQKDSVRQREQELEDGHGEFAYSAVIAISAASPEALEQSCSEVEELASQAGMTLRSLGGRHDQGVAATLPLARSIAARPGWKDVTG